MSVLIKGIGKPKDGEHPYWVTIHSDGIVEYNENKGQGWQTSEAVSVPPHGRLIDADALANSEDCKRKGCVYQEEIFRAPTIIPAEEALGEDLNVPGTYDILYEEGGPDTR